MFIFNFQVHAAQQNSSATKLLELNRAARIVLVLGDVAIYSTTLEKRTAQVGDYIFEGESIVTGADGELHLNMEDSV